MVQLITKFIALFVLVSHVLLPFVVSQKHYDVEVDGSAQVSAGGFGNILFVNPSSDSKLGIQLPFTVSVNVELSPVANYDDWMICYTVDDGLVGFPPYCMSILVEDNSLSFQPMDPTTPPPLVKDLSSEYDNQVVAWFASIASKGVVKWGLSYCKFKVLKAAPKFVDGSSQYLQNDDGNAQETDDNMYIIDNQLRSMPNAMHYKVKKTETVCGAVFDYSVNLNKLVHVVKNVMKELPMVRPIHFFHSASFNCGGTSYTHQVSDQKSHNELCSLVEKEAIILHPLTVDFLTFTDKNRFMKSPVFYRRLLGSDKAFVFDENTVICSHSPDEKSGGGMVVQTRRRSQLIKDFANKFDFVQCNTRVGYHLLNIELSLRCAEGYGALTGDEDVGHFLRRCIANQGGRMPNLTNSSLFCLSGSDQQPDNVFDQRNSSYHHAVEQGEASKGLMGSLGVHNPDVTTHSAIRPFCPELSSLMQIQ